MAVRPGASLLSRGVEAQRQPSRLFPDLAPGWRASSQLVDPSGVDSTIECRVRLGATEPAFVEVVLLWRAVTSSLCPSFQNAK